jgi:hypothetical protein
MKVPGVDGSEEGGTPGKRLAAMGREDLWGKRPAPPVPIPGILTILKTVYKEICDGFDSSKAALHFFKV